MGQLVFQVSFCAFVFTKISASFRSVSFKMQIEKVLNSYNYKDARAMCFEGVYRNGMDKTANKLLLDFSICYGEVGHVEPLMKKLQFLGVDTKDSSKAVEAYCEVCRNVNELMSSDGKELLELCLKTAEMGVKSYSKRSLFLRVAIVKCHIKLGRIFEAKKVCYELLLDAPDYVPAIIQEGVLNFIQGSFEVSVAIFKRAEKLDPGSPDSAVIKAYQKKAEKFVELEKKAAFELAGKRHHEAIVTFSSLIILGLNDKASCKDFLVPLYNSRAICYQATNQMNKLRDDCLKSLNIKLTTEAEDMLGLYFDRKRELQLKEVGKLGWEESMNKYLVQRTDDSDDEELQIDCKKLEPLCELNLDGFDFSVDGKSSDFNRQFFI